jgi:hypothetical protein
MMGLEEEVLGGGWGEAGQPKGVQSPPMGALGQPKGLHSATLDWEQPKGLQPAWAISGVIVKLSAVKVAIPNLFKLKK